jgi:hypothetical protein
MRAREAISSFLDSTATSRVVQGNDLGKHDLEKPATDYERHRSRNHSITQTGKDAKDSSKLTIHWLWATDNFQLTTVN